MVAKGGRSERIRVLTEGRARFIEVPDERDRSTIGSYWNAIKRYVYTGDDTELFPFEGEAIEGYPLETDRDAIDEAARRGEVAFEDIYEG